MTPKDRDLLRSLAGKVRELANLPEMETRRQRWFRHNALQAERPLVLAFPEGAWKELLPESALQCDDKRSRAWERQLRMSLFWWDHIRDDNVLEPYFDIHWRYGVGNFGVEVKRVHGENRGSFTWEPPIKDLERDFEKLHYRPLTVDRKTTEEDIAIATQTFGDLLPVRMQGSFWWSLGITTELIQLIGLETLMLAMYDTPEALHRLMAFVRDEHLDLIQRVEREGLLTINNTNGNTGSGGVAYTHELPQPDWTPGSPVRLKDLWGLGESQETVGVSPDMFAEFIFPYQLPILEKFGLNCYGCCEPVHERWQYLRTIPRLRRLSISPWCDQAVMAEALGRTCIFSRKPNPSPICLSFSEEAIRKDLRHTLDLAGKGVLEFILKDTHTVQNEPWRITRWVELALEEVRRYAGE